MNSTPRLMRPLLLGAVAIALASTGGCGWFKSKSNYTTSVENRPLEVPPDLDLPDTNAATMLPATRGAANTLPTAPTSPPAAAAAAAPSSGGDFILPGTATAAFPRIGAILEGINGVVINGKAEALGSYDVTYKGQNFLIRATDSAGGSRLVALSPDGNILNSGPAVELMATIKSEL